MNDVAQNQSVEMAVRILRGAVAAKASDVHLRSGVPPLVRIDGELCALKHPPLTASMIETATQAIALASGFSPNRLHERQIDFSCQIPEAGRFRAHAYMQDATRALVLRFIPMPVPDFTALRLPPVVKRIAQIDQGLVLVTGATGNGKSTTIASLLEHINQHSPKHVVTIEDPIEYVFEDHVASFSQREVGRDVDSVQQGLEGILREDPDVLFIGEIRTLAEFEVALNAAESGRLVISSFHASDIARAIHRMVHFYPDDQRESVRVRVADALSAVIAQKLLPKRNSRERILTTEVLTRAPTVQECIRDAARLRGLAAALDAGSHEHGTHSFDQELIKMVRDNLITVETARAAANSPNDLVRTLKLSR